MDFLGSLGEANTLFSESNEALVMLNRDVDLILNNSDNFDMFIRGQNLVTPTGVVFFVANAIWKVRSSGSCQAGGKWNPSLPSWTAFYGIQVPESQIRTNYLRRVLDGLSTFTAFAGKVQSEVFQTGGGTMAIPLEPSHEEASSCVICMENMPMGQRTRGLPCGHVFHEFCVDRWLRHHDNCPTCRLSVVQ